MKRLSGGLVLLNLTAISLGLTSGEVNITDAGILEELKELRQFIDVNRDFSKGFKNLKPILIEYRSNASKFNGITQANLSFNTDALHMSIGANTIQADGKLLVITINVVYEYTDYVGYTIKSAKLKAYDTIADGDATFTGDVGVGGDLAVTGDLSVTGDTSGIKIEDLVDSAGNKRFIEGDLSVEEIEGLTITYAKWSLSGTHLMFVLAGQVDANASISAGKKADVNLPSWIANKIYPTATSYIDIKTIQAFDLTNLTTQNIDVSLRKYGDENIRIETGAIVGDDNGYGFRIAFDLLIDTDYE